MTRILVISDTHLQPGDSLPVELETYYDQVEMIIHAGDFICLEILEYLQSIKPLIGVCGNVDDARIAARLPVMRVESIEGVSIGLIHGQGSRDSVPDFARSQFDKPEMIIFGHTHIPFNKKLNDVQMFNPGSITSPRGNQPPSFGLIEIESGKLNCSLHELYQ